MSTPHPLAAILTGAEGDPKLADENPRDRQFFLDLGGHAGRAHSSAAIRTARRQRYVVAHVYSGWSAPAGRLAVLRAGSSPWAFRFGLDGLGEGSRLAIPGASRGIELSFQAGVLLLEPFDPPLQPFSLALALFELPLHARKLLRRRPGDVLLTACRAHTRFIGTCAILCTPDVSHRRLQRSRRTSRRAARTDAVTKYEGSSSLLFSGRTFRFGATPDGVAHPASKPRAVGLISMTVCSLASKARRFAPPSLRGADGLDASSAHGPRRARPTARGRSDREGPESDVLTEIWGSLFTWPRGSHFQLPFPPAALPPDYTSRNEPFTPDRVRSSHRSGAAAGSSGRSTTPPVQPRCPPRRGRRRASRDSARWPRTARAVRSPRGH